jgi:transcriptional antiterminator
VSHGGHRFAMALAASFISESANVAEQLGVSLRLVQRELKAAQDYLAERSGQDRQVRF